MIDKTDIDYSGVPTELLLGFKHHLRIMHSLEDEPILMYLTGAIDAISIFSDTDIFRTKYKITILDYETCKTNRRYFNTTRQDISAVVFTNAAAEDILETVDKHRGYVTPIPIQGDTLEFEAGYLATDNIPLNLVTIIYRYAAHLYENREAINIGEPKFMPDWVQYALPSIWKSRV